MMTGALKYANSYHSQNYVDKNINIFISYFERNENNETHVCNVQDIAVQNLCELSKHESV